MADYNSTNLYYSTPPVPGEPFLGQTSATEEVNGQANSTFNQWNTIWRPGPMIGSPTGPLVTTGYGEYHCNPFIDRCLTREFPESVTLATPYENQGSGHDLWSYPGYLWPVVGTSGHPNCCY